MLKVDKKAKDFIVGNVVGIITGIVTLYIYYDYIEKEKVRKADSPPNPSTPDWFGQMNITNWKPLTPQQINQITRY